MDIVSILITWLITSVSLFILSKLPTGVEIDSFKKALLSAGAIGLLNALILPILGKIAAPILGVLFSNFAIALLLNMLIFGLTAWLVDGFWLRWGIWSALLGSVGLSFINSILFKVLVSLS